MPSRVKAGGSLAAGAIVALVFRFWVGWPGYVAILVGAFFGVGFLIVAAALGEGYTEADAAWRSHSADLLAPPSPLAPAPATAPAPPLAPHPETPPPAGRETAEGELA
jgi:hypothetical protein